MSKKRTSKKTASKKPASKKTASKKIKRRSSKPRKGAKKPFKMTGSRGVRASQAKANRAKRERKAKNAKASRRAGRSTVTIPVPAGYTGPLPGVSAAGVIALTPAARKRARKLAKAAEASGTSTTVVVPVPAGYTGAVPGVGAPAGAGKKARKTGGKKTAAKKTAAKKTAAAAPKKRKRTRAKKGSTRKFQLMHKWGFPRGTRARIAPAKKAELRQAASTGGSGTGGRITFNDIMNTIHNEKLKSWVCVGPRRTGCGGGAKNLRGGHQIGIFGSSR